MIYYFSGTGNSKWVAGQLAERLGDKVLFIPEMLKTSDPEALRKSCEGAGQIGLVFPIYAWGVPPIVMDFARILQRLDGAGTPADAPFRFAVATCGEDAGKALRRLSLVFPWNSAYSVVMPNNCVVLMDVDTPEKAADYVEAARERVPQIADHIKARQSEYDVHEGPRAGLRSSVVNPLFTKHMLTPKGFSVEDSCNGCGLCERNCPTGCIKLENGRPVWNGNCLMCMSCICRCPQKAIQHGGDTKKRGRYYFKEA